MPLISYGSAGTSFDTLPAIKIQHYHNACEEEQVYAYLKLFSSSEGLHFSSVCFEKTPAETSRTGFLFNIENISLLCSFSPSGSVTLYNVEDEILQELSTQKASTFTGTDEQGSYWTVEYMLPFNCLPEQAKELFAGNGVLTGNFLKYWQDKPALGSYAALPQSCTFPAAELAVPFEIVSY